MEDITTDSSKATKKQEIRHTHLENLELLASTLNSYVFETKRLINWKPTNVFFEKTTILEAS